jgi:hypothetical protein
MLVLIQRRLTFVRLAELLAIAFLFALTWYATFPTLQLFIFLEVVVVLFGAVRIRSWDAVPRGAR